MLRHIACRTIKRLPRQLFSSKDAACTRFPVARFAKKQADEEPDDRDRNKRLLKILEPMEEKDIPNLSEEDAALMKEATKAYSRLKMAEHRAWQKDLSIKFQLKRAALAALPEDLRKLADRTQEELVPLNRQIFTETPPIPGYRESQQGQQAGRGRGRRR